MRVAGLRSLLSVTAHTSEQVGPRGKVLIPQDPTTHLITDLVSFYSLPSSIMKHPKHKILNAAYMYYYASDVLFGPGKSSDDVDAHDAKSRAKLAERLNQLVEDMLTVAHQVRASFVPAVAAVEVAEARRTRA